MIYSTKKNILNALGLASADVSKKVGPDIANLKTRKYHETGQNDFL